MFVIVAVELKRKHYWSRFNSIQIENQSHMIWFTKVN